MGWNAHLGEPWTIEQIRRLDVGVAASRFEHIADPGSNADLDPASPRDPREVDRGEHPAARSEETVDLFLGTLIEVTHVQKAGERFEALPETDFPARRFFGSQTRVADERDSRTRTEAESLEKRRILLAGAVDERNPSEIEGHIVGTRRPERCNVFEITVTVVAHTGAHGKHIEPA